MMLYYSGIIVGIVIGIIGIIGLIGLIKNMKIDTIPDPKNIQHIIDVEFNLIQQKKSKL